MSNHISDKKKILISYAAIIAVWQSIVGFNLVPDYLFPSPLEVILRLFELLRDGFLLPSVSMTLYRMLLGYTISACAGVIVGLSMGTLPTVNGVLRSLFLGLQTLPSAAWAPISLMLFGLRDEALFFVIVMSSLPAVAIATADAVIQIPPIYIRAAQTLGLGRFSMLWRIIVPAALPRIATGIKLGWTLGWHGTVSAELIKSSIGLGYLLHMGRELSDAAQVVGIMIVMIVVGLLFDLLVFGKIERRIRVRWGLA